MPAALSRRAGPKVLRVRGRPAQGVGGDPGSVREDLLNESVRRRTTRRGSAVRFLTTRLVHPGRPSGSEVTVKTIHHVVDIDATDGVVWRSLTDESALASWWSTNVD